MKIYLSILIIVMIPLLAQSQTTSLPITEYDYHLPENNISAVSIGMGGLNLTNTDDYFTAYENPALLADNESTAFATSFQLAKQKQMTFLEMASLSNVLKEKQFTYFTLQMKNAAFSYQPMASVHTSEFNTTMTESKYYDYQLDKVQLSLALRDKDWSTLAGGLNIKYLTGRLVYLREAYNAPHFTRIAFIDDKVKGYSADLGFTYKNGDFTWGIGYYDIYSQLFWENYDTKHLQSRAATGFQYNSGNLLLTAGLQGIVGKGSDTTFHFGMIKSFKWDSKDTFTEKSVSQDLDLRLGLYSEDFYGTQNIYYTLGSGYYYNLFRFDFAMTNKGMVLKDSKYLFTLGVGIE